MNSIGISLSLIVMETPYTVLHPKRILYPHRYDFLIKEKKLWNWFCLKVLFRYEPFQYNLHVHCTLVRKYAVCTHPCITVSNLPFLCRRTFSLSSLFIFRLFNSFVIACGYIFQINDKALNLSAFLITRHKIINRGTLYSIWPCF